MTKIIEIENGLVIARGKGLRLELRMEQMWLKKDSRKDPCDGNVLHLDGSSVNILAVILCCSFERYYL